MLEARIHFQSQNILSNIISNIGKLIARYFAKNYDIKVAIVARHRQRLEEVKQSMVQINAKYKVNMTLNSITQNCDPGLFNFLVRDRSEAWNAT